MKLPSWFSLISIIINITIFFYFVTSLYQIGALDVTGLLISGFGIIVSLVSNIIENFQNIK